MNAACRDVNVDGVAVAHESDRTARCRFRRGVADGEAGGAAGEAAIGEQRAGFAQPHGFQVAGRVKHFLHPRAASGAFVADDDDVARLHFALQDAFDGGVLAFVNDGGAGEAVDAFVHAGGFDDAAVFGDVAVEDSKAAFLRVGVFDGADAAVFTVVINAVKAAVLRKGGLAAQAGRAGFVKFADFRRRGVFQVVAVNGCLQAGAVHGRHVGADEFCTRQLGEDVHDAARAVHVFDVVLRRVWRDFAQLRNAAREGINVFHGVIHARFLRGGEQVEDGVGGAAHGNV